MHHPFDESSSVSQRRAAALRALVHRNRVRVKAAEAPHIDPMLVFLGVVSLIAFAVLSVQSV